jgi:hypothetical protein
LPPAFRHSSRSEALPPLAGSCVAAGGALNVTNLLRTSKIEDTVGSSRRHICRPTNKKVGGLTSGPRRGANPSAHFSLA